MALKRLLREHGIPWQSSQPKPTRATSSRITRSSINKGIPLPHLPVEIQLKVLFYALTSPHPIVDPLCKRRPERMLPREKAKHNDIAIHVLATCRAYQIEGTNFLWSNNTFLFTSPANLRQFAELNLSYRQKVRQVTFRVIARFYDDEDRAHRLPASYHPTLKSSMKLTVQRRPKEKSLARGGFRAYAWYQLIDFLEAMLPPYDPACKPSPTQPRPRLLPALEALRIDFVNFVNDVLPYPPQHLHDLASHQLGCTLNEVIMTGVPSDECGLRVSMELAGLLKDEGLLVDHDPTLVALKDGVRSLRCTGAACGFSSKVVRGMRGTGGGFHDDDDHHGHNRNDFPPAPPEEGEPPPSIFHSCRTIWKKVPTNLDEDGERQWQLFDRVSGLPWEDVAEDATVFDFLDDELDPVVCENCGECHPGALPPIELMELWDDDI